MRPLCAALLLTACASTPNKPAEPTPFAMSQPQAAAAPQGTPDSAFRAQPPAPGAPVEFHAPVPQQLTLKNGLRVYLIERHGVPLVSVSLALRSGADTDPPGKAGLSSLALDLL